MGTAAYYEWIAAAFGVAIAYWFLAHDFAWEDLWLALGWKNRKQHKTAANPDPHYDLPQNPTRFTTTLSYLKGKDK